MEPHPKSRPEVHTDAFLRRLMRGQLRLSIACAATFLVALFGLPLLNYYLPDLMSTRVLGFTLSWLVLGILFFPLVWLIAWVFVRKSIALEQAEVDEAHAEGDGDNAGKWESGKGSRGAEEKGSPGGIGAKGAQENSGL